MSSIPRYSDYPKHVAAMVEAAVAAVDPYQATQAHVVVNQGLLHVAGTRYDLENGRLILIAVGKAAVPMSNGAVDLLGTSISSGVAVTKAGQTETVNHPSIQTVFASHPVSDEHSVAAANAIQSVLEETTEQDFVLFLISGGASALCTDPHIPLESWQSLSKDLLASGCDIQAFNTVRKQLDRVKGGGLAEMALPARFATLVLSDVIGNPISMIGSGPTVPNPQTVQDALDILEKFGVNNAEANQYLFSNRTKKPAIFDSPYAFVGDLKIAALAAQEKGVALGFETEIGSTELTGEAREVGRWAAERATTLSPGTCLITGGETTVTLNGTGIGGRNQELALAAALEIVDQPSTVIATYATDGDDGPTDAAGAIVTAQTVPIASQVGLNPAQFLANNDSYTLFKQLEDHLIITGQTGTNVTDLLFVIRYAA